MDSQIASETPSQAGSIIHGLGPLSSSPGSEYRFSLPNVQMIKSGFTHR